MENLKSLITDKETWTSARVKGNQVTSLLRYRTNLQDFIKTDKYNTRLTITWNYNSTDISLMPNEKEMDLMNKVENALVENFEHDLQAVLAFVFLGENRKEWYWYTKDIEEIADRVNSALSEFDELPIELSCESDSNWNEYKDVIEFVKE